jgi:hypothetical protein
VSYKNRETLKARKRVMALTEDAARDINRILDEIEGEAGRIAKDLTEGNISKDEVVSTIREVAEANPYIFGVVVAYAPYAYFSDRRLYAPYYARVEGRFKLVYIEDQYDYTVPKTSPDQAITDWYIKSLKKGWWMEPYFGTASKRMIVVYAAPFFYGEHEPGEQEAQGVVAITISMDEIKKIIKDLDLGYSGFPALISSKGVYLSHPNEKYVREQDTILEVAKEKSDETRKVLRERILKSRSEGNLKGQRGIMDHTSTTTGLASWLIYEPVEATGWSLQNTFIKGDIKIDVTTLRRQLIWINLSAVVFLVLFTALLVRSYEARVWKFWVLCIVSSLCFQFGIGYTWYLSLAYDDPDGRKSFLVMDNVTLQKTVEKVSAGGQYSASPVIIPTGLFIETMNLKSTNEAEFSGYIWQIYSMGEHDGIQRGIISQGAKELVLDEVSRKITEKEDASTGAKYDGEVVLWAFRATVMQKFDYRKYPLNQEEVRFSLVHPDPLVMLVPDLDAYPVLSPTSIPGMREGIAVSGWKVIRSCFEFEENGRGAGFGLNRSVTQKDYPRLSFNVKVRRNFIDSFVSNLTPLILVGVLLFMILLMTTRKEELRKLNDIKSETVMRFCAALFFVVVFSHIDIRQKIASEDIFYLEFYFFIMYAALLAVTVNSMLFFMIERYKFLQYRDNLMPKILYWPGILSVLYIVTIATFY